MIEPERPAPSAKGTLERRPLAHLLAYASEKKLTGSLVFGDPDDPVGVIVVKDGAPIRARAPAASDAGPPATAESARVWHALADLPSSTDFAYYEGFDALRGTPRVDVPALVAILRVLLRNPPAAHVRATIARIGPAALAIDPNVEFTDLDVDLGEGARAALEDLRQRPFTLAALRATAALSAHDELLVYGLLITKTAQLLAAGAPPESSIAPIGSSANLPDAPSSSELPAAAPIASAAEDVPDSSETKAAVARVRLTRASQKLTPLKEEPTVISSYDGRASVPPPVKPPTPVPPAHLEPAPAASARPNAAAPAPAPPAAVARNAQAPPPAVRRPAPGGPPRTQTKTAPPPPPPATSSSTPAIAARRQEILDRAASIDTQNYFQMLGIPEDLPTAQVQAAFIALAKKWHPDRLPAELANVREACGRVFSRLSEASSTLCDDEQRTRYMRLLTEGGAIPEDQEKIATVVEAATTFQKAEVMLKRGDLAKAEELCALAVRLDAQPDYVALLAWVESLKPANQSQEATRRLEATLTSAIEKSERCERAIFYRATLRKRLGDHRGAMGDFRRAFELNPRNLDAQREIRLFEMRLQRDGEATTKPQAAPPGKPSLIGRFFKK
jgi:hypothetical protein